MEPAASNAPRMGLSAWDDFSEVELAAQYDRLLSSWREWASAAPPWPPAADCAFLVQRALPRLQSLAQALDRLLVVGIVGGTGTGKSTLVNALVGQRICAAGERRPTTTQPLVVYPAGSDPECLDLGGERFDSIAVDAERLGELVLVDCPDPDTQGPEDGANRNREILRRVLPHCDVILHLGTAQKYSTHAVVAELVRAAPGHEIVFVQTRAELDHDIREDWRQLLASEGFAAASVYRVDSEAELADPARNHNDFGKLREHLFGELGRRLRRRIKRSNLSSLYARLAEQCRVTLDASWPAVERLQTAIDASQRQTADAIGARLHEQLASQRHLWRGRLLKQTLARWGSGPFAAMLRLLSAGRTLVDLALFWRARGAVQLAVAGAWRAGQSIAAGIDERRASDLGDLGLDAAALVRERSILDGYARDALVDPRVFDSSQTQSEESGERDRRALAQLAGEVGTRLEAAIAQAAALQVQRRAGGLFHFLLECLFGALLVYVVGMLGRNYFFEVPWEGKPLLGMDFLVHSAIWLFVWAVALRWWLVARLQRGLRQQIGAMVKRTVSGSAWLPRDERLTAAIGQIDAFRRRLAELEAQVRRLPQSFPSVDAK